MDETQLEELKKKLPDVQQRKDDRGKRINKVGIRELIVPIKIYDLKGNIRNTVGNISLYVSLEHEEKGISMSRLAEIVHEVLEEDVVSTDIIRHILKKLREKLNAKDSYIKIHFDYFVKKEAPVSKLKGYMNYKCSFEGKSFDGQDKIYLRVIVPYTSLCPCSKEISKYSAHNQKSFANILVELNTTIKIEDIIKLVDECASCPIYTVLKRPDEKYVTERAYENPMFVEDMIRAISLKLDKHLDKEINDYVAVVDHQESIHLHNAVAIINCGRELK